MQAISRLTLSAFGMHLADQIALVSVPLAAALVFGAPAEIIGILVACQSMAHLLGSIPFGLLVDRGEPRRLAMTATLISATGCAGAALSVEFQNLLWFGGAVTTAGFGVVLFVLVALSIVPRLARADQIAASNARIEIPRALAAFSVPLAVGAVIVESRVGAIFGLGALGALLAFVAASGLPHFPAQPRQPGRVIAKIAEGGAFVLRHELLLPISLCAIFWNLAFSGLLVVALPLIVDFHHLQPGVFGGALASFGLAAVAGSWTASRLAGRIAPNVLLLFGPGSSALATLGLLAAPQGAPALAICASFFALGFGPSMWLIAQNSVRQLVTPGARLGRVNAVIQTAIYGVRPLGALIGGAVVGAASPRAGLILVALAFCCSFAAALFSRLRKLRSYGDLSAPVAWPAPGTGAPGN
ncbi:MAG: MFS transporter [Paracoccaceae bacterium]